MTTFLTGPEGFLDPAVLVMPTTYRVCSRNARGFLVVPVKFDDAARAVFLTVVRAGGTRSEAAIAVGISTSTVRQAIKMGLDEHGQPLPGTFAEDLKEVELACVEKIEHKLYEAAEKGEPWAVQMWLKGKAKDTWADKPGPLVQVNNLTVAGTPAERLDTIARLGGELDRRKAAITVSATPLELPDGGADPEDTPVD